VTAARRAVVFSCALLLPCAAAAQPSPDAAVEPPPDAAAAEAVELGEPHAPSPAERQLLAGLQSFELGLYEQAEQSFAAATEQDPTLAKAWTHLAATRQQLGQPEQAEKAYHRALEADPDLAIAALRLADLLAGEVVEAAPAPDLVTPLPDRTPVSEAQAERLERALDLLARVRGLKTGWSSVLLKRARILRRLGRADEAEAAYTAYAGARQPAPAEAWFELGELLEEGRDRSGARGAYERAALASTAREDRERARARILRLKVEQEAERLGWPSRHRTIPARARRLAAAGRELLAGGSREEAEARLRDAVTEFPYFAEARALLAACLLGRGQVGEAEVELLRAAAADESSADVQVQLGDLYRERFAGARAQEAVEAYRRALQLRPDLNEVRFRLAEALRQAGRFEEAIPLLEQYIADGGGEQRARATAVLEDLTREIESGGRPQPGPIPIPHIGPSVSEGPPDEVLRAYRLARAYLLRGRADEARAVLDRLGQTGGGVELLNLRGAIERAAGRRDAALGAFRASLALRPNQGEVLEQTAALVLEAGDRDEAEYLLQRALELGRTEPLYLLARITDEAGRYWNAYRLYGRYLRSAPTGLHREAAARRVRELRTTGGIVLAAALVPMLIAAVTLALRRRQRRAGVALLDFARAHPEDLSEVMRLIAAIRHEVLKHNATALDGLVAALRQGEPASELAGYCVDRFFGADGASGVAARLRRYIEDLEGIARARDVRLNLRHRDRAFSGILAAIEDLRRLSPRLTRLAGHGGGLPGRTLERLAGIAEGLAGGALSGIEAMLERLGALPLTERRLAEIHSRTVAEPAFAGVDFAEPAIAVPESPPAVMMAPRDLDDLLTNLLRNAARATIAAEILPVPLGIDVRTEEDLITGLRFVIVTVLDRAPGTMSPEDLRRRDVSRGLGLAAEICERAEGALLLDTAPEGWTKAIAARLPAAEEDADG